MVQVSIREAQTQFSRLLVRVEDGEEIVINRSGVPIARLVPIAHDRAQEDILVKQQIAESREQIKKGQFFGPFSTAEETIESLHKRSKRKKRVTKVAAR
jgi:prevent-host-death family protein